MEWNKRDLGYAARLNCPLCRGDGFDETPRGTVEPCECAFIGIFRACHEKFRTCVENRMALSKVSFDRTPTGRSNRGMWGLKREEYIADFEIIARRTLRGAAYKLFRFHHLLGASPELCARRLRWTPLQTTREIARIERTLGKAFATLKPYGLFPLYNYFNRCRREGVTSCLTRGERTSRLVA